MLFKYSEKINLLTRMYSTESSDAVKSAVNCLMAIEQKDSPALASLLEFYENDLKKIIDSDNSWWINLTFAIINLNKRKLNKERCTETIGLLEKVKRLFEKDVPSFVFFYAAHAYFERSKVQTNTADGLSDIKQANSYLDQLMSSYCDLLENNKKYQALILNLRGNISMKEESFKVQDDLISDTREDLEKAESFFLKAKEIDETFEFSYNGLGNIYRERCNYKMAIFYYNKAIKCNAEFMYPWNFLGDCFRILEEYEVALKCYKKALEICNEYNNFRALPLYGIGRVYYELGNRNNFEDKYIKRAELYFEKAESFIDEEIPQSRFILKDKARILQKMGNYSEAKKIFERIRDNNLFFKQKYYQDIIDEYIKTCDEMYRIKTECQASGTDSSNDSYSVLKRIMCRIDSSGIEKRAYDMKEVFDVEFLKRYKISETEYQEIRKLCEDNKCLSCFFNENRYKKNTLQVLRRWNSYTPIINSGRGGGYFLKVDGVGIVIDPGFNFIKNYKDTGNYFRDIDVVLISHAHDDHTADLESILNLQYRYNKRLKNIALVMEISKEYGISAGDIEQQGKLKKNANSNFYSVLNKRFNERKNKIISYMSPGAELKYSSFFNNSSNTQKISDTEFRTIIEANKDSEKSFFYKSVLPGDTINISDNCKIWAIKALHNDLIEGKTCLGFLIELPSAMLVYTGDTGWYKPAGNKKPEECLFEDYSRIYALAKEKNKRLVLIAHLGGFKENEINFWRSNEKDMFYDNHLGRVGLYKAVETLRPEVCIISEYGEEFNGMRLQLTDIFNNEFEKAGLSTVFLPGDIGLTLDFDAPLSNGKTPIKVISGIDFKNRIIKYDYVEPRLVAVGEYRFKNLLFYYRKNSNITENDIVQAFIDGYADENDVIEISL